MRRVTVKTLKRNFFIFYIFFSPTVAVRRHEEYITI